MLEKIKSKIRKNTEIFALSLLIIITVISTTFYNQSKEKIVNNYKNTINNVYVMLKCVRQILVTLTVHTSLLKILTIQIAN